MNGKRHITLAELKILLAARARLRVWYNFGDNPAGEGDLIAIAEQPTVVIRTDSGQQLHFVASLPMEALPPSPPKPQVSEDLPPALAYVAGAETDLRKMIDVARDQLGRGEHRNRVKLNLFAAGQKLDHTNAIAFLASALVLLAEQPRLRTLDEIREKR